MSQKQHQGRPKEYDVEVVINAAMHSFWRRGYEACSLTDLLDATELSKSSLYQSFGNKKQLFLMTLSHYCDVETKAMDDAIRASKTGFAFFDTLVESICSKTFHQWNSGCLVANTAAEFGQNDPDIAIALKAALDSFTSIFEAAITKGHKDGTIPSVLDAEEAASYLLVALNGLRTMVKAGMNEAHIRKAGHMILKSLT